MHVYHYCTLRFHKTTLSDDLFSHIDSTYGRWTIRTEDGAYIGGSKKFENMRSSISAIIPVNNVTLKALLDQLAVICADHYAMIDSEEYDRLYTPVSTTQPTRNDPAGDDSEDVQVPQAFINLQSRIPRPRPRPRPTLQDHRELQQFFEEWGAIRWRSRDRTRSSEDFLKKVHLAPNKDNAFGSEWSQSRATTRVKQNDGTPLDSVSGDTED